MSPADYSTDAGIFPSAEKSFRIFNGTMMRKFLSLTCALALEMPWTARAEIKPGDAFPSLEPAILAGAIPATTGKVTLVDFWASWCAPCKDSFSTYTQLQADYASHGLVIVAVSVDQNQSAYDAFIKKMAPSFSTLRDKDQLLVREVKVPAMPTCYLLGRDGHVRFIHQGFHGAVTERDIRREINTLLTENSPAS